MSRVYGATRDRRYLWRFKLSFVRLPAVCSGYPRLMHIVTAVAVPKKPFLFESEALSLSLERLTDAEVRRKPRRECQHRGQSQGC
jgi:hypothetical protein